MSSASSTGFVLSGKWRRQFDWAVVEWNRDNTFEHPVLRNLPDGDLSALTLTYEEERSGCIPFESNLYPVVAWDRLRLWVVEPDGTENIYYVKLYGSQAADAASNSHAVAISGTTQPASASMSLIASPGAGKRVGLAFAEQHYYHVVSAADQLSDIAAGIANDINSAHRDFTASSAGNTVTVTYNGTTAAHSLSGANGNRLSMYGFVEGATVAWNTPGAVFSNGSFPGKYRVSIDFGNLYGTTNESPSVTNAQLKKIPTSNVRKIRWTWMADMQPGNFAQTEFQVKVSNWSIAGANHLYSFAGAGSRRIQDFDSVVSYSGNWLLETANYSGSKIHYTSNPGGSCSITYNEGTPHQLYLGLRRTNSTPLAGIQIDSSIPQFVALALAGEDVLVRHPLGTVSAGTHTVSLTHAGTSGTLYFDFLEIVYPSSNLPEFPKNPQLALATDWDTYHSQSLPAERTAWLIQKLGFTGRVNHYVGALWFYEIVRTGTRYASLTVDLQITQPNAANSLITFALAADQISLESSSTRTEITHLVLADDTSASVAQAFAGLINVGSNLVWASASGNSLTITARDMGGKGNGVGFKLLSNTAGFAVSPSSTALAGGIDGAPYDLTPHQGYNDTLTATTDFWRTDLTATPRLNRAARDWHAAFFVALKNYALDSVAAFSAELMNGDPSAAVGIAQRYPDGTPVVLNTPAIQTNFSPTCLNYWKQVYSEMAALQHSAGLVPYLQSGEVQWWYFPKPGAGMPLYDAYTLQQFKAQHGKDMGTITSNTIDPALFPDEVAFLPTLIGAYTSAIRDSLRAAFPGCRYEVLYPTDTNNTPLSRLINYPADWTSANLTCLKTESFDFTRGHDLVNCTVSINTSAAKGFPNSQRSHLVGIGDAWSAWLREVDIAQSQGLESVVLFALDQYCLIGYPPPPFVNSTNSLRQG